MKNVPALLRRIFVLIMFFCVMVYIWYIPAMNSMQFSLQEAHTSLETSQGRERKQTAEYDQVQQKILDARNRLELLLPEAEAVRKQKDAQIAEKKALKQRKSELEAQLAEKKSTAPSANEQEENP